MNRISELRKEIGMSQSDLAKKLGVHPSAVSQWEGEKSVPKYEQLENMSVLFDASIRYLLGNSDSRDVPIITRSVQNGKANWSEVLKPKLLQVGCTLSYDAATFGISIVYPDGVTVDATDAELSRIQEDSNAYMQYILHKFREEKAKQMHNEN